MYVSLWLICTVVWWKPPGEGNGNPLQYSCLENPLDRGAWWATIHGVTKSWTRLSDFCVCVYGGNQHNFATIKIF